MMINYIIFLIIVLVLHQSLLIKSQDSEGICPNNCNNKGTCGAYGRCTCYNNLAGTPAYKGYDCSQYVCPYGLAWISEIASKANDMRPLAECR